MGPYKTPGIPGSIPRAARFFLASAKFIIWSLIVTSSAIDKKLEIDKNLENNLEIDKNLDIKLEIYKKSRNL